MTNQFLQSFYVYNKRKKDWDKIYFYNERDADKYFIRWADRYTLVQTAYRFWGMADANGWQELAKSFSDIICQFDLNYADGNGLELEIEKWYEKIEIPKIKNYLAELELEIDQEWSSARKSEYLIDRINFLKLQTNQIKESYKKLKNSNCPQWLLDIFNDFNDYPKYENELIRLEGQLFGFKNKEIDQSVIDDCDAVYILSFFNEYHKKFPFSGGEKIDCPFHNEKTPSCAIYNEGKGFYCYGCGRGGGAIRFVMDKYEMPFYEAINFLKNYI